MTKKKQQQKKLSQKTNYLAIPDFHTYFCQAERRAHHNALERKRRDHIKESFSSLRDSVPSLHGEKVSKAGLVLFCFYKEYMYIWIHHPFSD